MDMDDSLLQEKFMKEYVKKNVTTGKTRDDILADSWTLNGPFVFFVGIVIILVLILTV
jgi:hypothetical protein